MDSRPAFALEGHRGGELQRLREASTATAFNRLGQSLLLSDVCTQGDGLPAEHQQVESDRSEEPPTTLAPRS